jgi:hypothetical protein
VQLDEAAVRAWEHRPAVRARGAVLMAGYDAWAKGRERTPDFPGVRFYLLHSLSHLVLNAIAIECGYSAAALGERLYCAPRNDAVPMAGFLISTGTPGTEGTLGGLVEQGKRMLGHLQRAYDMGRLCSTDPVCAYHQPASDPTRRYREGAACHGCLYVAEPSCEWFNCYLDRALVVPVMGQPAELAFFSERPVAPRARDVTKAALPLGQLSRTELEFLRKAIVKRQLATPLSEAGLASLGKAALFAKLGPLAGAGRGGSDGAHRPGAGQRRARRRRGGAAIVGARADRPEGRLAQRPRDDGGPARAPRRSDGARAHRRLRVRSRAVLFGPLHKAMAERNVKVTIYLNVPPAPGPKSMMSAYLAVQAHQFLKQNWPFGAPLPQLYYFPAGCEHGESPQPACEVRRRR